MTAYADRFAPAVFALTPDVPEVLTGLGGIGLGAVAVRLASLWVESRKGVPSRAKDTADLMAAGAAFQLALNNAAQGIVADLRSAVERLEAEVEDLKIENERCRTEAEALKQADRERGQQFRSLTQMLIRRGIDLTADDIEGSLIRLEGTGGEVIMTENGGLKP